MRMNACPRCREVEPDTHDHATGIRLCDRCQGELYERLSAERTGEILEQSDPDKMREAYERALAEAHATEREINHALEQQADELHKGWRGDY